MEKEFGAKMRQESERHTAMMIDAYEARSKQVDVEIETVCKKRKFAQLAQHDAFVDLQNKIAEQGAKNDNLQS